MIPRIEHIGQPSGQSWARRFRNFWNELFGSRYAQLLERDLVQARLERDRAVTDLKAAQERLVEVLATTKGIPMRPIAPMGAGGPPKSAAAIPATTWQQVQAEAIAENARAEAAEAKEQQAAQKTKEN